MSYYLADANGYIEDFASIGGLRDLNRWAHDQDMLIQQFFDRGYTEQPAKLAAALGNVTPGTPVINESVTALRKTAQGADSILIISDGASDEDDLTLMFDPEQPRDPHGMWTSTGGSTGAHETQKHTSGIHATVEKQLSQEQGDQFRSDLAKLPPKIQEQLRSTNLQLVKNLEDYGRRSELGTVEGSFEHGTIMVKAGERQTTSLYHEVGHATQNHLENRPEVKAAFAKDTAKGTSGQMRYFASSTREAIAQSFAYHMGARDVDYGKFVKTFKQTHEAVGAKLKYVINPRTGPKALAEIKGFKFDKTNPAAQDWAEKHAGELITGISQTTREAIKDSVERAFEEQFDVDELSDEIAQLIGDDARADTIARTETMRAANEGQQEAWDQAIETGLLSGDEQQEWIATADEKLCPICGGLDGQQVGLDENFEDDGDEYEGPPAHPNCRCTVGLVAP